MTDKSENLHLDDVVKFQISPDNEDAVDDIFNSLSISNTFEVEDFIYKLCVTQTYFIEEATELLMKGTPCRVLTARGQGWRSGKVKLSLQFIPDEPEMKSLPPAASEIPSLLDEVRKQVEG
ncbi:MAG: KGK domain-containing protein [Pseudanabaenaceae cyanobacterium]|jgi:hypothetical protein